MKFKEFLELYEQRIDPKVFKGARHAGHPTGLGRSKLIQDLIKETGFAPSEDEWKALIVKVAPKSSSNKAWGTYYKDLNKRFSEQWGRTAQELLGTDVEDISGWKLERKNELLHNLGFEDFEIPDPKDSQPVKLADPPPASSKEPIRLYDSPEVKTQTAPGLYDKPDIRVLGTDKDITFYNRRKPNPRASSDFIRKGMRELGHDADPIVKANRLAELFVEATESNLQLSRDQVDKLRTQFLETDEARNVFGEQWDRLMFGDTPSPTPTPTATPDIIKEPHPVPELALDLPPLEGEIVPDQVPNIIPDSELNPDSRADDVLIRGDVDEFASPETIRELTDDLGTRTGNTTDWYRSLEGFIVDELDKNDDNVLDLVRTLSSEYDGRIPQDIQEAAADIMGTFFGSDSSEVGAFWDAANEVNTIDGDIVDDIKQLVNNPELKTPKVGSQFQLNPGHVPLQLPSGKLPHPVPDPGPSQIFGVSPTGEASFAGNVNRELFERGTRGEAFQPSLWATPQDINKNPYSLTDTTQSSQFLQTPEGEVSLFRPKNNQSSIFSDEVFEINPEAINPSSPPSPPSSLDELGDMAARADIDETIDVLKFVATNSDDLSRMGVSRKGLGELVDRLVEEPGYMSKLLDDFVRGDPNAKGTLRQLLRNISGKGYGHFEQSG